jgi:hypothetical protein
MFNKEQLNEKWQPVLEHTDLPEITDPYRRAVTSVLLENQEIAMKEQAITEAAPTNSGGVHGGLSGNSTPALAGFDPVLISLVRRSMPQLIAFDIAGVQPMTGPVGLIFAMKSNYVNQAGAEAGFNEYDTDFSSTVGGGTPSPAHAADEPGILNNWGGSPAAAAPGTYTTGDGMTTAVGEGLGSTASTHFPEMAFNITKTSVEAKTRALKAEYSVELQQDLKAVHGLDAEGELANILSQEILGEINREVIRTIYYHAKKGAADAIQAGIINGASSGTTDLTGRWDMERFKEIAFVIEKEANIIGIETRRGKGTFVICSSNVASALAAAGAVNYLGGDGLGHHDVSGNTFVGTMGSGMKVYVDPYSTGAYFVVGYRGTSAYDAGIFYCPYVPLQMVRAMGENTFQPKIAFKTRYGMVANPFAGALGTANGNQYYRRVKIENLL